MGARGDGARGEVRVGRGGGRRCRCACEEGEGAAGSPHRAECLSRVRQARKKLVVSRGAAASIAPGGDGFACPASGCKSVFDTAEEALEHGATHGLSGEREVDDEGKSCCLWQGCDKKAKATRPDKSNKHDFGNLRQHEALHVKGPKPREAFICPECDEAFPTSAAAWACAATHDVEEDPCKCLWAGCGRVCTKPAYYREHESVRVRPPPRVAVWPPTPHRPSHPAPHPPALPLSAFPLTPDPAARRRCTRESGPTTAPRAIRASPFRVRLALRHTPCITRQRETAPLAFPWQSARRSAARSPPRASAAGPRRGTTARATSSCTSSAAAAARRPSCWAETAGAAACRWLPAAHDH